MKMIAKFKKRFYFAAAKYFRHFANRSLKRWHPRIIAITGSAGKTTVLHLAEHEIGKKAHYSHDANSAFGISFDILNLKGIRGSKLRWIHLILAAPIKSWFYTHKAPFYVVEIDGERPHETEFLATWLKPEVTIWVSIGLSHAVQFENEVKEGNFDDLGSAIAAEFATLPQNTQKQVYIDADSPLMRSATKNVDTKVIAFKKSDLKKYGTAGGSSKELDFAAEVRQDYDRYFKCSFTGGGVIQACAQRHEVRVRWIVETRLLPM